MPLRFHYFEESSLRQLSAAAIRLIFSAAAYTPPPLPLPAAG
jgi:hypothetical protein